MSVTNVACGRKSGSALIRTGKRGMGAGNDQNDIKDQSMSGCQMVLFSSELPGNSRGKSPN